jgi:hypothetical protein
VTGKKIQQHYYTRAKRGLFQSVEGYDSVAKSPSLDDNFIKRALHAYCKYDAPAKLVERGEKDLSQYPDSILLFHTDTDEMILGRSAYVQRDFTGLRPTFLMHQYIIPQERKENYLHNWGALLNISFEKDYIPEPRQLEELDELPSWPSEQSRYSVKKLLESMGIEDSGHWFVKMLYGMMNSISGKKKVYVSLNVESKDITKGAKVLLHCLIPFLPHEYRSQLGVNTYSRKPENIKNVHITFVDKDSVKQGDRTIERDYLFDFARRWSTNIDAESLEQPFIQYALNYSERPEELAPFFEFCEKMLRHMAKDKKLATATYDELHILYEMHLDDRITERYHKNQLSIVKGVLQYLNTPSSLHEKQELHDIFHRRVIDFEKDKINQRLPSIEIINAIREYFDVASEIGKKKVIEFLIQTLGAAIYKDDKTTSTIYAMLDKDNKFAGAFFSEVFQMHSWDLEKLFLPYVNTKLGNCKSLQETNQQYLQWHDIIDQAYLNNDFQKKFSAKFKNMLSEEPNIILGYVELRDTLKKVEQFNLIGIETFHSELLNDAQLAILRKTEPHQLSIEELKKLDFLMHEQFQLRQSAYGNPKIAILRTLYQIVTAENPSIDILDQVKGHELLNVKSNLERLYKTEIRKEHFPHITLAFLNRENVSFKKMQIGNYRKLFNYLHNESLMQKESKEIIIREKDLFYDFLKWAMENNEITLFTDDAYKFFEELEDYLLNNYSHILKKQKERELFNHLTGGYYKRVIKKVEDQLENIITKFLNKRR